MSNENPLRNEIVTEEKKTKKKKDSASTLGKSKTLLATPYGLWMAAFIIIPLILVLYYGLTDGNGNFTLDNLSLIANPINRKALWLSLKLSLISTAICLLLAYPLALVLKSMKLKDNSFIVMVVILPMWMNFLLRTIAWQNILEKIVVIYTILEALHLPALIIINTPTSIVLGMLFNFLPFMILPIYNTLAKIDDNVINAARDLGANGWVTFKRVIFPLSMPGVISGITMVFVPSLTTFAISTILGGSKIVLIGNIIEQQFQKLGNWNTGSGLSIVLMIFILVSMTLVAKYDKDSEGTNAW